ncbi:uncharacterized membrane protein At1g16860-like isoform X2 [Lycium barbarum]|uniref:uncharacterized membrane protein At1g16860-like isoform X2 n=1 Tax=Lycium barbarum TaxID=112863 RepID=UPI00293EF9D1|nr:uncharacterized membrane protein At1g16860-like isoform X2 [Lycium barbarum]
MGSRFPSHQLSGGLYVSGRPEQPKEKAPTMSSVSMPYTGGDIKKSGELGKMFVTPTDGSRSRKSGPINNAPLRTGSMTSGGGPGYVSLKKTNSGPLNKHGEPMKKSSGPQGGGGTVPSRQNSGPIPPILPTTGLITSGPLNSAGGPRKVSGPLDSTGSIKLQKNYSILNNQAVTRINQCEEYSFRKNFPKTIFWSIVLLFVMGFIAGGFILAAVHNPILLVVVVVLFAVVCVVFTWNTCYGRKAIVGLISQYPDAELRTAKDGQFVKVSGGHVSDFYISDFQSGLRALVKTGYGARVTPYVEESTVVDIDQSNRGMSPEFVRWLAARNLSSDDRIMRLKEGYIKEGSTVSVMGVVQRNDNVLMIVPPPEPFSTGCQWAKCILPASLDGIVLRCEDSSKIDVIPV